MTQLMNAIFRYSLILFICLQLEQMNAQRYLEEVFPQVSVTENVLYGVNATVINATTSGTADPQNLFLDIYQPSGDSDNSRPLVIYLHSGNFLPFPQNQTPSGTRSDFQVV
ncbi:MAG: hypothetical protein ACKOW8_12475, partial [Flavobacteriales bacterium]